MTEDTFSRRQVSRQHLELLVQYMERYPPLALASARSREGHVQSKKMWEKIARTLNRIDENVTKPAKSWARYWIDLKFKTRRKYAVIQKCHAEGTRCTVNLTPLEENIVKILTDDEGNLLQPVSVCQQVKSCHSLRFPVKKSKRKASDLDSDPKIEDSGGLSDSQDDFLVTPDPEHVILPESDIKPNIAALKPDGTDPIEIVTEEKKSIEDLKRELLEFELRKQKESFEMEKEFRKEKHELEMSILRLKKQILNKGLKKL